MAKQIKARRVAAKRVKDSKARELWLASLGAASLTRKQGIKMYQAMIAEGRSLQGRVLETVQGLSDQAYGKVSLVNEKIGEVRAKVESKIMPLRHRAEATYLVLADEVTVRLQPLLKRFGLKVPGKRVAPAKARKAVRGVRKTAKRVAKKAA